MLIEHCRAGWMPDSHGHTVVRGGTTETLLTNNCTVGAQGREIAYWRATRVEMSLLLTSRYCAT